MSGVFGAVLFEMRTGQRAFPGENLPFVSPDSQWVGLVSGRMVNKISVQARAVVPLGGEANVTGGDMGRRCQPTGFTLRRKTGGAVAYLATPDDRLRISNKLDSPEQIEPEQNERASDEDVKPPARATALERLQEPSGCRAHKH